MHSPTRNGRARARSIEAQGFKIMLGPDVAFDAITSTILSGRADDAFFASLPQDITPSTDDKPFFFYTKRLGDIAGDLRDRSLHDDPAITITLLLIAASLAACVYYVAIPFFRLRKTVPLATLAPPVAYFSAIGIGFMLIEISQMQRLMVFLGHPVYGLGVVLFTLLLFSGIGSATVSAAPARPTGRSWIALVIVAAASRRDSDADHRAGDARKRPRCAFLSRCSCSPRRRSSWA